MFQHDSCKHTESFVMMDMALVMKHITRNLAEKAKARHTADKINFRKPGACQPKAGTQLI